METQKFDFLKKKFKIRILTFDEELKSPLIDITVQTTASPR